MPRHKTGSAIKRPFEKNGKKHKQWFARIEYVDDTGIRKRVERKPDFNTKTSAREKARQMLAELDGDSKVFDVKKMTFSQLASYYKETFLIEPQYRDGRKIAGLRSKYDYEKRLIPLKEYFDGKKLRSITHGDLQNYKARRLKTPIVVGRNTRRTKGDGKPKERERSIATVHRELSLMRRILNVAVSHGWLLRNPFEAGESLIKPGDEKPRERILTQEEEEQLLALCNGEREHLKAIIICALDTGMRRGEMFRLKWSDVDLESGLIMVQALNTKTLRQREVGMTDRLADELRRLSKNANGESVFGIKTSAKNSFNKVKTKAGLTDLRFHDLRHTNATRLVGASMPLAEVGRMLGHTQPSTTYRYVNANADTAKRAAELLNQFNKPQKRTRKRHSG